MTKNGKTLLMVGAIGAGLYMLSKGGGSLFGNAAGAGNMTAAGSPNYNVASSPAMSAAGTQAVGFLQNLFGGGGGGAAPTYAPISASYNGGAGSPALTPISYAATPSPAMTAAPTTAGTAI